MMDQLRKVRDEQANGRFSGGFSCFFETQTVVGRDEEHAAHAGADPRQQVPDVRHVRSVFGVATTNDDVCGEAIANASPSTASAD